MSGRALVARRFIFERQFNAICTRQKRTYWRTKDPPKDQASILTRRLLSKNVYDERLYFDHRTARNASHALEFLARRPRYKPLASQKRFAWFRDIVTRGEIEGFGAMLKTGVRHALDPGYSSSKPSELLRRGESLLQTPLAPPGWTRPATLNTIGLEDADSTVLRLLTAHKGNLEEEKQLLRVFNAFISRIEGLGHPVNAILAGEGQCLAANAHSVGALVRYAEMAVSHSQDHSANPSHLAETMSSVRRWVLEDELQGTPQKAALSAILTRESSDTAAAASQAFRSQFISLDPRWRWDYLDVLRRLYGPQEVLAAWSEFQTTPRWEELAAKKSDASTVELASILHDVVEQLIIANEPQLAWVVVHSLSWHPRSVLLHTWDLLLDFPEYFTKMTEGMQEVLLRIYEEKVERIEQALGVRWTGGEDGSHVLADGDEDPQALIEAVNISEEVHKD